MAKGKKTGGRKKGAPNTKTAQWETFSRYCLEGGLKKFRQELDKLEGKDYVHAFTDLLEFHKPKLARSDSSVDLTTKGDKLEPASVTINYIVPSGDNPTTNTKTA